MMISHTDDKAKKDYAANPTQSHFIFPINAALYSPMSKLALLYSAYANFCNFFTLPPFRTAINVMLTISLIFQPHKDAKISIISTR
jgi:hypothetical protein